MNPVLEKKMNATGPLTRQDIAEVLVALGGPGENREGKRRSIKDLCEKRRTGTANGHAVWDALDDFPEY